jgi:hypothetical protein
MKVTQIPSLTPFHFETEQLSSSLLLLSELSAKLDNGFQP